eukprot:10669085-Prorocentrum_lima.AAC.1
MWATRLGRRRWAMTLVPRRRGALEPTPANVAASIHEYHAWRNRPASEWARDRPSRGWVTVG